MSSPAQVPTFLVLQHIGCEPAAAYGDELAARGLPMDSVLVDQGQPLPDWHDYAGILAMGGPMGTYDEAAHPWLVGEKRMIAEAVGAGTPFWGVCLGAQLLAASLGARVFPGPAPEVGVAEVSLTPGAASDPVFAAAPASFAAFHWHGDTYELPAGAKQLARSGQYEQQAFSFARAYGLQFHLEVTPALVAEWGRVPAYASSLEQLPGQDPLTDLLEQVRVAEEPSIAIARALFARWLTLVAGVGADI